MMERNFDQWRRGDSNLGPLPTFEREVPLDKELVGFIVYTLLTPHT